MIFIVFKEFKYFFVRFNLDLINSSILFFNIYVEVNEINKMILKRTKILDNGI
jgi:hypothetical protein